MQQILEKELGISINKIEIFQTALTHRSAVNEDKSISKHNERLEFLGDAVLELIVTEYLFTNFPEEKEGVLTNLRSSLVKGETLAEAGKELNLGQLLTLSKGEDMLGGRIKVSLMANTMEAIIGAIYLDSGFSNAKDFVIKNLIPKLKGIISSGEFIDAKSYFQQYAQAEFKITPHYLEIENTGPDHDKVFTIAVMVKDKKYGSGTGKSKQAAQQAAARNALDKLKVKWQPL
jgi:ribonuclease-3